MSVPTKGRPSGAADVGAAGSGATGTPVLAIDWTRCDGHGLCSRLLPGAVVLDEWGYPILDQARLATLGASQLKRAVGACPALALRLA